MSDHDVPFLKRGTGQTPRDGGCIMQVVSWIAHDGEWTDCPRCVLQLFKDLSIEVNDSATDAERQRLLDLAPRLMNTQINNVIERQPVNKKLLARYDDMWNALCEGNPDYEGGITVNDLAELLDLYDEITGRPKPEPLDFTGVCAAMAGD